MKKARILIVEDEAIIAMEIGNTLQNLGYEVTSSVDTGEKAILKAEEDRPDLIFMDIRIKGELDGIQAAEVIRNKLNIPVIFSTAYLDEERIERAKITMPFGYVLKPIQERDLKVTLEMALYVAKVDAERRKTEEQLKYQRNIAQQYLNVAGVLLIALDIHGNITEINPKGCEILGYGREEVIGCNWFEKFLPQGGIEEVKKVFNQIVAGDILPVEYYENPIFRKDGTERYMAWHNSILKNDSGEIVGLFSSGEDITKRKLAEKETLDLKEFYEEIFERVEDGIWVTDFQDKMIYFNPGMEKISGVKSKDAIGLSVTTDFPKETIEHFITDYKRAKETLVSQKYEAEVVTPVGRKTVQSGWLVPRILDGKYGGMICTIQDITERTILEQKRHETVQHLNATIQAIPDLMFEVDKQGRRFSYHIPENQAAYDQPEVFQGKLIPDVLPDDAAKIIKAAISEASANGSHIGATYQLDLPDGKHWYELSIAAKGDHSDPNCRFIVLARNVTNRIRAEEELRKQKDMFELVINSVPMRVFWKDLDSVYLGCNSRFAIAAGRDKIEDIISKNDFELVWGEIAQKFIDDDRQVMSTGLPKLGYEEDYTDRDGNKVWCHTNKMPLKDNAGNIIGILATSEDITVRKEADEKINFQSKFLDCIEQAVIATDLEGKVLYFNKYAEKLYQWTTEEALTMNIMDVTVPQASKKQGEEIMAKLANGKSWEGEFMVQRKDGSTFLAHIADSPILDDDGSLVGIIGISREVEK